jgi:hypothetical protein
MLTPRSTPRPGPRRVEMDQGGWEPIATAWTKPLARRRHPFVVPVFLALSSLAIVIILAWPLR